MLSILTFIFLFKQAKTSISFPCFSSILPLFLIPLLYGGQSEALSRITSKIEECKRCNVKREEFWKADVGSGSWSSCQWWGIEGSSCHLTVVMNLWSYGWLRWVGWLRIVVGCVVVGWVGGWGVEFGSRDSVVGGYTYISVESGNFWKMSLLVLCSLGVVGLRGSSPGVVGLRGIVLILGVFLMMGSSAQVFYQFCPKGSILSSVVISVILSLPWIGWIAELLK